MIQNREGGLKLIREFPKQTEEKPITIKMDITVELPLELANEAERLGICEFDKCVFDSDTRRMTATYSTKLYKKGA